jgi:hypothetical protein
MSAAQLAAQLAEREKAKSLPATESKPHLSLRYQGPTPQKAPPAQQAASKLAPVPPQLLATSDKAVLPNKAVVHPFAEPKPQPPVHPAPSADDASADDYLRCGPGRSPLPATRAEFAAQVLKAVGVTPRTPTASPPIPPKPNPPAAKQAINQTATDPATATIQTPKEPVNQRLEKKKYQVRLHPVMPVTGSEPQWGWTTDP